MARSKNPENKGLPERWRFVHGAYYFQVPKGQEINWDGKKTFRLGKTLPEAYKAFSERINASEKMDFLTDLFDRFLLEEIPLLAPKTQTEYRRQLKKLRVVFGHLPAKGGVSPRHIYSYIDKSIAKVSARREIALLSKIFTCAVKWGCIDQHPFKGQIRLKGEQSRSRYVEDWEIAECLALPPKRNKDSTEFLKSYIQVKLLTGMSKGDLLRLKPAVNFTEDGILIHRHKIANRSKKRTLYEWSPELRAAIDEALAARPTQESEFLFCNRRAEGYMNEQKGTASGFDSIWQRFMNDRVLVETKVTERFTEHDIRAKVGSDAESDEHARAALSHTNVQMTKRAYRRKPDRVKPLSSTNSTKVIL